MCLLRESLLRQGLLRQSLRAFAAGAAAGCAAYALAAPPAEIRVPIDNFTFKPDVITVPVGTRIVWQNDDDIPHSVVETQGLDTEDKYAFTFAAAGTFEYFSGLHPHMKGKVIVIP